MKAIFISYELPPLGGGGGRAALEIAGRLARRGHGVAILSSLFPGLPASEERGGVLVRRIRVRRRSMEECSPRELLSFMMRSIPAAERLAAAFRPAATCAFFGIPGGPAAWWLRKRRGIPYVLSLRGSDVPRPEIAAHQRLHALTRPFLRQMYRDAAGLIAVSDPLRRAALAVAPSADIQVIPNGVDAERFRPSENRAPPAGTPNLLFVGRLREFKGVQDAILALPAIERMLGRPVRLTVAGEGPSRPALEEAARRIRDAGAASEVRFLGWLAPADLPDVYRSASVLLLPSYVEGHSNVILEALASGLPCVASDAPGIRETVTRGREGILVPPRDPDAIARATAQLLSSEETWLSMSRNARARALEFSWDRIASDYEAVLLRAADHKEPRCGT